MLRLFAIMAACVAATGCASVVNQSTQSIKVETKRATGDLVVGADCRLSTDRESLTVRSGHAAEVQRSGADMQITCKHPDHPDANARAISRANGGMYGNIILGGAIGAIIDHNKGTAYTYPTWVQLVFGRNMTFDRKVEQEGSPVAAIDAGGVDTPTPAPAAPRTDTSGQRVGGPVSLDDLSGLLPARQ